MNGQETEKTGASQILPPSPKRILGLMSGSSLDGVDLAGCYFFWEGETLKWRIEVAQTIPFSSLWYDRLAALPGQSAEVLARTHVYFGRYLAELINSFLTEHPGYSPDLIASHGHTVYHDPDSRFTCQIGDGGTISALTRISVACDFRSQDVALDGEGAPLAPLADKWLFPEYAYALNLGGIANLTWTGTGSDPRAGDIAPANQVLNAIARTTGVAFDPNGRMAASGTVIPELLYALDALPFYSRPFPRSLGNQWIRETVLPLFAPYDDRPHDALRTAIEHLVHQIERSVRPLAGPDFVAGHKGLVTGGGAWNTYLMERLRDVCKDVEWRVPSPEIVDFKEALLMAFLGLWRMEQRVSLLQSVTGASENQVLGALYLAGAKRVDKMENV